MPDPITKSMLLNIGVFEANDAVRRNTATYALNYRTTSGEFRHFKANVGPATTRTYHGVQPETSVTVLRVNHPVTVVLTFPAGVDGNGDPTPAPDPATIIVKQFTVIDQDYITLDVTTGSAANTRILIHQA